MTRPGPSADPFGLALTALAVLALAAPGAPGAPGTFGGSPIGGHLPMASSPTPVGNLTGALQRTVTLLAVSGSGLLAIVWARVALSWFSNDLAKKVQAKDRARDALIGTAIFVAAVSGLFWGLAHWIVTGT